MSWMDGAFGSNDEWYTPISAITPLLPYIPEGSKIWCPFDTEDSLYPMVFRDAGHTVVCTHLETGQDFFKHSEPCDLIISNPPYSLKTEVFTRLYELDRPFAMLTGMVGLFEGPRFDVFDGKPLELMLFNRRIVFLRSYYASGKTQPPFSSAYVCSRVLPSSFVFCSLPPEDNLKVDVP